MCIRDSEYPWFFDGSPDKPNARGLAIITYIQWLGSWQKSCLLYTSDAADERSRVDLGGRGIIKKKNNNEESTVDDIK